MLAASQIVDDSKWPFVACLQDGTEVSKETECQVSGVIPSWLEGQLYRTGPGIYEVNSDGRTITLDHWFDGAGITHLFEIKPNGGGVTYRNCITSKQFLESVKQNGLPSLTFGQASDPCQTLFQKVFSFFKSRERSVNVNVTVTPRLNVPGQAEPITVLKTDSNVLQILDSKTLEPVDQTNYRILNGEFAKGALSAAHEEYDPVTNSIINLVVFPGNNAEYVVFESNQSTPAEPAVVLARFKDPLLYYQHSFSSTTNYVIIQLWPVFYKHKGLSIMMSKTLTDAMEWDSKRSPRIVVIDRREKRVVAEYEHITPEFCFHTVNAFEDGNGDILMDAIVYKTGEVIPAFLVNTLRESREFKAPEVARARELIDTTVKRIRLPNLQLEKSRYVPNDVGMPVNSPKTMVEFHAPVSMELPRINPKFRHREDYRYVYGVSAMFRHLHLHTLYDSLVKFDAKTQSHKSWMKVGHTPSEPMFVPNPNGNGEDDGVVLSIVLDGSLKKSYMLVLDAKSFEEIAKADIGQALPYGLHGAFV